MITVVRRVRKVKVICNAPIGSLQNDDQAWVATGGQSTFAMKSTPIPNGIAIVRINGRFQSPVKSPTPDYVFSGANLIFSQGLNDGDDVAATWQRTPAAPSVTYIILNYFFYASAGQTVFTLPGLPRAGGQLLVVINGTAQSLGRGDYTLSGQNVTLNSPLNLNDEVSGFLEQAPLS